MTAIRLSAAQSVRLAIAVAAVIAAIAVPPLLSPSLLDILVLSAIYSILAIGLDILMGYTGLDSLGQAAFFGLAAYSLGILTVKHDTNWFLAAAVGLGACVLLAATFGLLAVRVRGLYFLLITLALGQLLWGGVQRWGALTGGFNGLNGVTAPTDRLTDPVDFAYLALAVFAIFLLILRLIVSSPFGLALRGCRDQELRMRTLGFRPYWIKWLAFIIAAIAAGVAGLLNASYTSFVSPSDISLQTSFVIMLMVIVGGAGSIYGAVIGAIVITVLQYELSVYSPEWWLTILGVIYMATTVFLPKGVMGFLGDTPQLLGRALLRFKTTSPVEDQFDLEAADGIPPAQAPTPTPTPDQPAMHAGFITAREPGPLEAAGASTDRQEVLALSGIGKTFGGFAALTDVTLQFWEGERTAIIGPNGAGKTTLFNVITGLERSSAGAIRLFGDDVTKQPPATRPALGMARTFQVTKLFLPLTVMDNLILGVLGWTARGEQYTMWRPTKQIRSLRERAEEELERTGLIDYRNVVVSELSYGHQKQLDIALALASSPKLLLLDEPTAGLSESEAHRMAAIVEQLPEHITVLIIEHNLDVVFRLTNRTIVLEHGHVLMDGPQETVRESEEVRRIYFGTAVA